MIDWLLRRLADRLGVEPARAGEAMTPSLRFEQPWPQGVTLLVVLACGALIIWLYRRESQGSTAYRLTLASVRIALVLLAIFMLSEAVLSIERTGLPYFVVIADDSASQRLVDQYENPKEKAAVEEFAKASGRPEASRWAIGEGFLTKDEGKLLSEFQKQNKVRLYLASTRQQLLAELDNPEDIKPALQKLKGVEPSGGQTKLGTSLREILTELRGTPPSAVLILSDGQTTEGESLTKAAELAARKGVQLFPVGLGSPEPARDLELTELLVDDVVFVDDLVRFPAQPLARGFAGEEVAIHLRARPPGANDNSAAREIDTIRVKAPPDGQPLRVEIGHRPKETGEIVFTLEVEPRPREIQTENNRIERTVTIRKEKLKVLLVEGEPRYEYRYLKNYLEREETIDLNVVLMSSDVEYSEQDLHALPYFPASKEELLRYDVVLIGDADPTYLTTSQMQNLSAFVIEKGGGLLFIAGESFNPLAYRGTPIELLLPVELADARNPASIGNGVAAFRPELTSEGRTSPIFRFGDDEATSAQIWENLPELFWFLEAPKKKPAAIVLAVHPSLNGSDGKLPLVSYQFVGAGKTVFSAFDDTWRWRFRVGDRFFGRYWIQMIRFLARSKLVNQRQAEVTTDRKRYQRSQPIQVRVRFPNPALAPASGDVTVQIEKKNQTSRKLVLKASPGARNVFEGALPQATEGDYEVRLLPPPILDGTIPSASFRVDAPAGEIEHTEMNEPELLRARI